MTPLITHCCWSDNLILSSNAVAENFNVPDSPASPTGRSRSEPRTSASLYVGLYVPPRRIISNFHSRRCRSQRAPWEDSQAGSEPEDSDDEGGDTVGAQDWSKKYLNPDIPFEQRLTTALGARNAYEHTSDVCTQYVELCKYEDAEVAQRYFRTMNEGYSQLCTDADRRTHPFLILGTRLRRIVHNLSLIQDLALSDPAWFVRVFKGKELTFQTESRQGLSKSA